MANAILSALVQLGIVLVIALAAWLIARRPRSFHEFIGLTASPPAAVAIGLVVGLIVTAGVLTVPAMAEFVMSEGTAHTAAEAGGAALIVVAAAKALIQTSLSEEILFRGLIGRNLIRRWGFAKGNTVQAVLFGAVHGLIGFVPGVGTGLVIFAILFSGTLGWFNGWLNERFGRGSILPGWAAHGTANFTTALWAAGVF